MVAKRVTYFITTKFTGNKKYTPVPVTEWFRMSKKRLKESQEIWQSYVGKEKAPERPKLSKVENDIIIQIEKAYKRINKFFL